MSADLKPGDHDVLIVVDVQNDFCPDGALAVPHGDAVVAPINRLARRFAHVLLTRDWHPPGHASFASTHPGHAPQDTVDMPYGPQILWPDHCVRGTPGAAFHADLDIPHVAAVIHKGMDPAMDSYSVFYENDRRTPTGLVGYLHERGFDHVHLAGLALDFCVRYSAEDARARGFAVTVVEDCCRAIDVAGSLDATQQSFAETGVYRITSDAFAT